MRNTVRITIILLLAVLLPATSLLLFILVERSSYKEHVLANISDDSVTVIILKDPAFHLPFTSSVIRSDSKHLADCSNGELPCLVDYVDTPFYEYYEVKVDLSRQEHSFAWSDTIKGVMLNKPEISEQFTLPSVSEEIPTPSRVYGRVVDDHDVGIEDSLVLIRSEDDVAPIIASTTVENGSYSLAYTTESDENFIQEVEVVTPSGERRVYTTASFYNQPVADIVFPSQIDQGDIALLQQANAANSCINSTDRGGIRIQCNDKIDWTSTLDTVDCPEGEKRFRLAVIKHTSYTQFHRPATIKLKLFDETTSTYVKDPTTNNDLEIRNGGYIDIEGSGLEIGKTYSVKAFDGTTECENTTEKDPYVTVNIPKGPPAPSGTGATGSVGSTGSAGSTGSVGTTYPSGTTTVPPMTQGANLCSKMGENFAIQYQIPVDKMQQAVGSRMRWGEALITDLGAMNDYAQSVINGKNVGINLLLRLCYKGNCNVNNGNAYGNAVLEVYNSLKASGQLPQNGLFIHGGHNEPNVAEYRDPDQEAQFVADVISVLKGAGILSVDPEDIGVKVISPNLDLYSNGDGQWPGCNDGCDDPNPHPIYSAQTYVGKMMENSSFSAVSKDIFAWAVNDYLYQRGEGNVVSDVQAFTSYLHSKGLRDSIIVTELGRINTSMSWEVLANTIGALDSMENIYVIMLFNSLGSNPDSAFSYHQELWTDPGLLSRLLSNCGAGNFQIPQEGSVSVSFEKGYTGSVTGTGNTTGVGITGVNGNTSGSGSPYGGNYNGKDPCLGNICVGVDHQNYATALGGLLNGNFEGGFVSDGAAELKVPQYWHAWYQNGCQGGMCGVYSCSSEPAICRRPEYKQSVGFANRVPSGGGASSLQWFTTYGTHHAGVYQQIDLGEGGSNDLLFKARASSWSDGKHCENFGEPTCSETDDCVCQVINKFVGRIGIDPTGGIDPDSPTVVWSEWKDLPNVQPSDSSQFTDLEVSVTSGSSIITVFLAANNEYPYRNSDAYWDAAELIINNAISVGDANTDGTAVGGGGAGGGQCSSNDASGPNGDSCWDPSVGGVQSLLGQEGGSMRSVLGAGSLVLPGRGEFLIESSLFDVQDQYVYNYSDDQRSVPVFQDRDGDGVFDPDEYAAPSTLDLNVTKVGDVVEIDLKPGVSIVSIPFYTEDFDEAEEILQQIIDQGGYATAVAAYSDNATNGWYTMSRRGSQGYGDGFTLSPGDAMYLVIQEAVKLRIRGKSYTSPVQQYMTRGWNLIALKGGSAEILSSELLEEVNDLPGVTASKVTVWDQTRGRFNSYVIRDGKVFGTDMLITDKMGFFLFVEEGVGYWTPDG